MSNTLLTIDMITKEALRVLHGNLSFVKNIDRQHDSSFAREGAKIGNTLRIRKPAQFHVGTGSTLTTVTDSQEEYATLTCNTQKHVGMNFTSNELTMSIDDFSKRFIAPAMSRLAAAIDADALSMYKNVHNFVGTPGTTVSTMTTWLSAGTYLDNCLAPRDGNRIALVNPAAQAATVAGLSGLFNDTSTVGQQYASGQMGKGLGFDWFMDQCVNAHTSHTLTTATNFVLTTDTGTDTTAITAKVNAGTAALKIGDVITIASVYKVNPETKQSTGVLQQFVVTANTTVNTTGVVISIDPPLRTSAATNPAQQTVSNIGADTAVVTSMFGTNSNTAFAQNLAYHKDAFTLATADLVLPNGVDMASRQTLDGISLRIVRQYDVQSDKIITRADVLYGHLAQRPEWACRVTN